MTVKYTEKIASQGGFVSIAKLLFRWRGSVYKMIWQDMAVYLVAYYSISIIYRFALNEYSKRIFEKVVLSCANFRNLIPVSFVLGFFVTLVVNRWWETYKTLPWPDNTAILVATHIKGQDAEGRMIRTTVMRYINLAIVMTLSIVSPHVKEKFPSSKFFVGAGYLTEAELKIMEEHERRTTVHKVFVPIMWACKLVEKANRDGRIATVAVQRDIIEEILRVKGKCGGLMGFNDHNIPLVYTQVVVIAVYSFYCISLIGEQILDPQRGYVGHLVDQYVPVFGLLQLLVYLGWIKVAEALLNPFGEDDHDFEFIPLLERHLSMSLLLGDPTEEELPPAIREASPVFSKPNLENNFVVTQETRLSDVDDDCHLRKKDRIKINIT